MNTKVIGSIIRWVVLIASAIGAFASNATFMDAINAMIASFKDGNVGIIISSVIGVITLGWSIWDKVQTQHKEDEATATIKTLENTVTTQAKALSK